MNDKRPIGIFDSGIGGLTVLNEMIQNLPSEDFIYLGDTARVPYGNKSQQTVIRYTIENANFLLKHNIKALVVACNTSSAYGSHLLKERIKIPVVDVIKPACQQAVKMTRSNKIAVLGTKATISSKAYDIELKKLLKTANLFSKPCPLFVPFIEENMISHSALDLVIKEYLDPVKEFDPDTILLGCTHYPLLKEKIQTHMGKSVHVVDSCRSSANELSQVISSKSLGQDPKRKGQIHFFVSDDSKSFKEVAEAILKRAINDVNDVS